MGHTPLSGPIQNEGWHPGSSGSPYYLLPSKLKVAFCIKWLPTLLGSILNERRHPGPSGHPPYPVLSKRGGNILDRAAFPLVWFYAKGGVTSRIMGPPPRSGAIQNEGGIPVHDATPYLVLL